MRQTDMERRLAALEATVEQMKARLDDTAESPRPWWQAQAGRFADDPVFDEIVRLGREYRESLRPQQSQLTAP